MIGLIDQIQRMRLFIVLSLVGLTVWAVLGLGQIGVDNAVEVWFPEADTELQAYYSFLNTFGNDETLIIGISAQDGTSMLSKKGLERLADISSAVSNVSGIDHVIGLSTLDVLRSGQPIEAGLLWEGEVLESELPQIQSQIQADPMLRNFVSADLKMVVLLAQMSEMDNIDAARGQILSEVREATLNNDYPTVFGGIGVVYDALNQASTQGSVLFIALSYALIAILLWLLFRRLGAMLLTLGVVGLSATVLMGVFGHLGAQINMVNMILPTIVLVIGVSSCVHMLIHVMTATGETAAIRAQHGIAFVFWPCLINTLTTCMGFLALGMASMPVVQDLGYFGAMGLVIAFVFSVLLCAIGSAFPSCVPNPTDKGFIILMVSKLSNTAVRFPKEVLSLAGVVALLALLGITRLQVDTYSIDFLEESHPVRVESNLLEQNYGPYTPLEFVISPIDLEGDPQKLQESMTDISEWQDALNAHPNVGFTRSLVDMPRRMNAILDPSGTNAIPDSPDALAQLLFLLTINEETQETIDQLYDPESQSMRVTVGVPMLSAKGFEQTLSEFTALADLRHVDIRASGYIPLYVRMMDYIVRSQLQSFGFAFLIIFVAVGLLFRSLRMAILSIPANLLPVLMTLGLMGLTGIRLDVATVTIAAIVLGLVVDDTVQFLYRYQHERARCDSEATAVSNTVVRVGRPMTITTIVLGLGFSVLGFAIVKSVAYFGLLLAFALLSALFSDLLVVPALIVLLGGSLSKSA
ncbi:MAG: efflux RND transporter permease subunit [Myxococcota bacterium]